MAACRFSAAQFVSFAWQAELRAPSVTTDIEERPFSRSIGTTASDRFEAVCYLHWYEHFIYINNHISPP
jgi:hypothetical protein